MKKFNINIVLTVFVIILATVYLSYKSYRNNIQRISVDSANIESKPKKEDMDVTVPQSWITYSSQKFGFSISYPPNWSLDDSYAVYSGKVVRLTSFSEKPTVTSRDLEIVIGSNEVYSTSGSVCANRSCQEVQISKIKINNKALEVPVIESSYQNKFEHYTFSITEDYLPPIYVSYHEPSELSEVVNILATIKPL